MIFDTVELITDNVRVICDRFVVVESFEILRIESVSELVRGVRIHEVESVRLCAFCVRIELVHGELRSVVELLATHRSGNHWIYAGEFIAIFHRIDVETDILAELRKANIGEFGD